MALRDQATRSSFIKYASVAAIMPMVVAIGGFLNGWARVATWIVAGGLNVVSALRGGSGEWVINPVHFAERHALFIIISLGEALVAIGASASEAGLRASTAVGLGVAAALACILWWSYFAYIPSVVEQQLRQATPAQRAHIARNLFTFGHFPLISGIVFFAIAAKHMVPRPGDTLPTADRWLLAGSVVTADRRLPEHAVADRPLSCPRAAGRHWSSGRALRRIGSACRRRRLRHYRRHFAGRPEHRLAKVSARQPQPHLSQPLSCYDGRRTLTKPCSVHKTLVSCNVRLGRYEECDCASWAAKQRCPA